jgi:hypothetical protein
VKTLFNQLRQHSVAIISLAVALSSLGYNTWRNEQTEANRNVRAAGIELLLKLGELDEIVFFSYYEHDLVRGNPHSGWAYVLTIKDLGDLMNEPAASSSIELFDVWTSYSLDMAEDKEAHEIISSSIDQLRFDTHQVLTALD